MGDNMRNHSAILKTTYAVGTTVETATLTTLCEVKSVTRSEFYSAYVAGLTPQLVIDINPLEYKAAAVDGNKPNKAEVEGTEYLIIRTFQKDLAHMELTLG